MGMNLPLRIPPLQSTIGPVRRPEQSLFFMTWVMSRSMVGEMKHLAQHDILTDLPNRMVLKDRLTQADRDRPSE